MDPQQAIDLSREALFIATLVAAPILLAGMFVGLIIGLMQALTQIQEQTVAFVPKLVAMVIALAVSLPWVLSQLLNYSERLISNIPNTLYSAEDAMNVLEKLLLIHLGTFTLVLGRVGALIMTAPIFGLKSIPMQGRVLMALMISLLVTPLLAEHSTVDMSNLMEFSKHLLSEVLIGLLFGVGITILLNGVQITGQLISQLGGTALADVFDPNVEENISVYSQFFYFLTLAMFVILDGHRVTMDAVLDSFAQFPPGQANLGSSYVEALTNLMTQSFVLGIRAAAPAMTALLLATLVLGLIGRTMPQINILAVGFGVNSLLSLGCLFTSIGVVAWAFPQQTGVAIDVLRGAISPVSKSP